MEGVLTELLSAIRTHMDWLQKHTWYTHRKSRKHFCTRVLQQPLVSRRPCLPAVSLSVILNQFPFKGPLRQIPDHIEDLPKTSSRFFAKVYLDSKYFSKKYQKNMGRRKIVWKTHFWGPFLHLTLLNSTFALRNIPSFTKFDEFRKL